MSTTKEKLLRRKPREIIRDSDEFYVLSMTLAESDHVDKLGATETNFLAANAYCLSHCLVEADGSKVFESKDDPQIQEIPIETALWLAQEIRKATIPPSVETTKKG